MLIHERMSETPRQLAERVGVTERKIRHLINTHAIEHVWIGSRVHVPTGAFARFIETNKVKPCQDETKGPVYAGSTNAAVSTSHGPSAVAAASARLARQTANKLKSSSPNGSNLRGKRDGPTDPASILVTDVLNHYLQQRGPKVAAPGRIAYAVLALTDFFEGNAVAEVTPQTCGRYVEKRGRSLGTVRRELGVLRAAINYAHKTGMITRTVAVELPERPEPRDRWLTRTEAANLIRAARTPQARLYLPLFILLGLYTGRRKEAILSLRWPQVDLEAGRIDFEVAGRRRTNKKRGVIQIPPRLLPHLRRARKRGTDLGLCSADQWRVASRTLRRVLPQPAGALALKVSHLTL